MAHKRLDAVQQVVTGTGSGALTLGAATSAKFKTAQAAGLADGDSMYARIQHSTIDGEWENVLVTRSGGTITRTVDGRYRNASGNTTLVNFTSGDKIMGGVLLADQVIARDADGTVRVPGDLEVGGNIIGNTGGSDFATAVQEAWTNDTSLNWLGGDVTLTAPILLQATAGKQAFGIKGNGATINCDFNNSASYAITLEVPVVSGNVLQGITVRNWEISDLKFKLVSAFAGAVQVRCLSNGSWFYSFLMEDLSCEGASDYAYWWNGSVFECITSRCKSTGGKGGFRITRADNALNGDFGLPSAMEMISPNFRDFGFGAGGVGNGVTLDCRVAFTEPFDLSIKGGYIVTGAGMGVDAPAGITLVENLGMEFMDGGWGLLVGYRGGKLSGGTRGANPVAGASTSPANGMRYLFEWWAATGNLTIEDLHFENEGSGTGMTLGKIGGTGTCYMMRCGATAGIDNSGCTIVNITP